MALIFRMFALLVALTCVSAAPAAIQILPNDDTLPNAKLASVNSSDVEVWLEELEKPEGSVGGHVNYQSNTCAVGATCTKAVQVYVMEWSRNATDCSTQYIQVTATTPIAGADLDWEAKFNPGAEYLVASKGALNGQCIYHVSYTNSTNELLRQQDSTANAGRKLRSTPDQCLNHNQCGGGACFPGGATVQMEDGSSRSMSSLQIGDKVAALGAEGQVYYDHIYAFGHKDEAASTHFVSLEIAAPSGAEHSLQLSPGHFINTVNGMGNVHFKRGGDVTIGDLVWAKVEGPAEMLSLHTVTGVSEVFAAGLYNPITLSGSIVVNGVAASVHSEWFLDHAADFLGMTSMLPLAYQIVLAPARLLWYALGKENYIALYNFLDSSLDGLDRVGLEHGGSITGLGLAATAVLAGTVMVSVKRARAGV